MIRWTGFRFRMGRATYGVTFGRSFLRPESESWGREGNGGSFWYAQAFGISVWRDSLPAVTVGERGAW